MALSSMTGFARKAGAGEGLRWVWEARSVNARGLDLRCRLPSGMEGLEIKARRLASKALSRGGLSIGLSVEAEADETRLVVNEGALAQALRLIDQVRKETGADAPSPEGVLALRGVLETVGPEETDSQKDAREAQLLASFEALLEDLVRMRREEGARMGAVIGELITQIAGLVKAARSETASQPEAIRAKLQSQIDDLLQGSAGLSEERLAQEAALLAVKADIREELDRLDAHLEAIGELLEGDEPCGRRLDFLAQELNREVNTFCSKSGDLDLKRIGLDMKAQIDQFREQVQNIE